MASKVLAALAVSATLFATTAAHAEDAPAFADKPQKTESRWYGYQTLATDAGAVALLGLALAADTGSTAQNGFLAASGATYALAPAVVHGTHGNPGRAVGDVAIRVFMPVVTGGIGGLIGVAAASGEDAFGLGKLYGLILGSFIGMGVGVVGAMALDASALAYEKTPGDRAEKRPAPRTGATITPSVGPTKSGFAAGLSGTF